MFTNAHTRREFPQQKSAEFVVIEWVFIPVFVFYRDRGKQFLRFAIRKNITSVSFKDNKNEKILE
ncbi:MAG: hypothetical protein DWQ02_08505 [Bacteroidetes bacterium]|nr:MAG: hypothetical protein DWQ02_08505 [Bacteroidota bacterium]